MKITNQKLTRNQEIVLNLLENSGEPLKAYTILSDTQKKGIKAPTQVYRALDKLIEIGKVHKIESKNSYVACNISNCTAMTSTSFLICEKCEKVTELEKENLKSFFGGISERLNFEYSDHNLEIFGFCNTCK
ncbi:MAG: Fur family transcriptional regulator [Alphaproteobacteria bacterium]|jgi:Fur family zinc uptake transcriptional regulator|nr:transcriptional repressor [SAR116 cluster bacterium]GIR79812.1 MAG: Fur family transcriptional regulator [Alphaproteobacteria bacterium]|tara:strand:+ start:962 stop:1357 length:396 start_codon:yes stop_codon:yes gene_type:complete